MKRARTLFLRLALLLSCALQAAPAQADLYVVVHAANPVRAFTQKELVDLYMGRSRVFAHGEPALPFDLARDSLLRERFYRGLTGLPLAQVNSYWSRLMFTGQTLPPATLSTEAEMAGIVRRNPGAIGYLGSEPSDKGLRVVFVIREQP